MAMSSSCAGFRASRAMVETPPKMKSVMPRTGDAKMPGYKRVAKLMGYDRAKEQTASDGADQPICGCCQTWTLKRKDDDGEGDGGQTRRNEPRIVNRKRYAKDVPQPKRSGHTLLCNSLL